MKKAKWGIGLLAALLVLGLVALLAACDGDEPTTTAGPVTTGSETTLAPTTTVEETTTTADEGLNYEIKFAYPTSTRASLYELYILPWTEAIQASSAGRVAITHYPDSSLVKEEQHYDAVLDGTCDMTLIEMEFTPGTFPVAEVGALPMLFPDPGTASRVYWDIIQEYAQEEFKDVQVLAVTTIAAAQYFGTKEVKVPADFAGLRIRTGGPVETNIINALGATPVEIGTGDLATSLERKMFDGGFLSWAFMFVSGAKDSATALTKCDLFYRCWVLAMNKEKWDALPAAVQQAFLDNSGGENSATYSALNDSVSIEDQGALTGIMKGKGGSFYELTAEEKALWKEAMAPVYQAWVDDLPEGIDGAAILAKIEELNAKYAGQFPTPPPPAKPEETETTVAP